MMISSNILDHLRHQLVFAFAGDLPTGGGGTGKLTVNRISKKSHSNFAVS